MSAPDPLRTLANSDGQLAGCPPEPSPTRENGAQNMGWAYEKTILFVVLSTNPLPSTRASMDWRSASARLICKLFAWRKKTRLSAAWRSSSPQASWKAARPACRHRKTLAPDPRRPPPQPHCLTRSRLGLRPAQQHSRQARHGSTRRSAHANMLFVVRTWNSTNILIG